MIIRRCARPRLRCCLMMDTRASPASGLIPALYTALAHCYSRYKLFGWSHLSIVARFLSCVRMSATGSTIRCRSSAVVRSGRNCLFSLQAMARTMMHTMMGAALTYALSTGVSLEEINNLFYVFALTITYRHRIVRSLSVCRCWTSVWTTWASRPLRCGS